MKDLMKQLQQIENGCANTLDSMTQCASSINYSDLEKRIMTHQKESPESGSIDWHTEAAMRIFGLKKEKVEHRHRNFAKNRNFNYMYSQKMITKLADLDLPEHPTHCKTCLDPLRGHEDEGYNVCRWCAEGWTPVEDGDGMTTGVMQVVGSSK
ncbi:putative DNA polymerase [Vibrio phage V-YDF132]|nr:putative DNA polymerase [Vibrio phage V-YDF132]